MASALSTSHAFVTFLSIAKLLTCKQDFGLFYQLSLVLVLASMPTIEAALQLEDGWVGGFL